MPVVPSCSSWWEWCWAWCLLLPHCVTRANTDMSMRQVAGFLGLPSPGEAQEAVKNAPPRNPNQQSDQSNPQGRTPPEVAGQGPEQAANAVQRENAAESPLNESAGPQSSQSTS